MENKDVKDFTEEDIIKMIQETNRLQKEIEETRKENEELQNEYSRSLMRIHNLKKMKEKLNGLL